MTGRGGWSKIGMPPNGTGYYQYLQPISVGSQASLGPDYLAVNFAVKAIQRQIKAMGYKLSLPTDGIIGPKTDLAIRWAQGRLRVASDGQYGPRTSTAMFWPMIQQIAGVNAQTVGGICAHESAYDPGAVGFLTPEDHGMVQINSIANPNVTLAEAFNPRFAFNYCNARITAAMATYGNIDIAICSYASPLWAQQWAQMGHSPNASMIAYVDYVKNWKAPS